MHERLLKDYAEKKVSTFNFFRFKYYFLAIPIVIATFLLLFFNVGIEIAFQSRDARFSWTDNYQYEDLSEKNYFIKTEGCTIPGFDPFDPSVVKYYFSVKEIDCYNSSSGPLVESNTTSLWIQDSYFDNYNILDRSLLKCCFRPFYRQNVNISSSDNRYKYNDECIYFENSANVDDEFVRVECAYNGFSVYKDFHSFVVPKYKTYYEEANQDGRFNVLVLGLDAVSRLNLHRTMPNTVKMLKEFGAVDFKGYNKVGDNTYPNLVPVLSGMNETELSSFCLPKKKSTFDNCPFIWKDYDNSGYLTSFAEDAANIALFNYLKKGFAAKPTDYYWRTFSLRAESEIGHEMRLNAKLCVGPRMNVDMLLNYVYKFVSTLVDQLYFGFFWETSLTHDYLNYPSLADDKYTSLLSRLHKEKLLETTVLIMLSDHGIRWGGIRSTHQGRMEERLPFLYVVLPEAFKTKYPMATANLKSNSKRLTTPFDLHETLVDLVDPSQLKDKKITERLLNVSQDARGISLFVPIGLDRTCQMADIDPHWCTCHEARKLEVDDEVVVKVAGIVVDYINSMLSDYAQCSQLNLTKIMDARIAEPQKSSQVKGVGHIVHDYTVIIHTEPGGGLFESTVRHTYQGWNVTGTVSRTNLYGKQSYCVDNFHLKLYCYCDSSIPKLNIFR